MKLDAINLRILEVLQRDGRITNQDLADRVGLSPSACLARVRRLELDGVIRRYVAEIAVEMLGHPLTVYAEIKLGQHRPEDFSLFERSLAQFPEIVEAVQISGPADYILKAVVPDIETWGRISDALLDRVRIESVATSIVMKTAKRFSGVPIAALADAAN